MENKLWTRNFTIITIGSIISMLGNSVSGFAIGLMVLDYTNSTFLYALFMVVYSLPKIVAPIFAGPYMDRFSRKKVIYTLDFISTAIYFLLFFLVTRTTFNYGTFLFLTLVIGSIDGVYSVAYESLYPNLISKGNYSKAYSISSMIYPLAAFMVPVASLIYNTFGTAAPLFMFNAVTFFIAACFETQINYDEKHIQINKTAKYGFSQYINDSKEGLKYILAEKGLLIITIYFCINSFTGGGFETLILPFFKNNPQLFSHITIDVITLSTFIMGCGVIGRLIGGVIHYKFIYPADKKFTIAIFVYIVISVLDGVQLYLPVIVMMILSFVTGILGVTSYNIRISATQSYLPDTKRGRFNGLFQMLCAVGSILGQLIAGGLGEIMKERTIIVSLMLINLIAVILVMYRGREHVKKIYNRVV